MKVRGDKGGWIVRVTIISRDNALPQFPSMWQEVLRTLFKYLAMIEQRKIEQMFLCIVYNININIM